MRSVNYFTALLFMAGVLFSSQSFSSVKLHYAGVAFMGDALAKETLYKYSSKLINDDNEKFQQTLRKRLKSIDNENIEIIMDKIVEYKKEDALIMAFALEYENVAVENIGSIYKINIDIRANILVFDYNEMKIIASYPIAIQLRDASDSDPTDLYLKKVISELYFSNKYKVNIFDEFVKRLSSLELKASYENTIKVSKVSISDNSKMSIPDIESNSIEGIYETFLAQMFSTYLSENQNVSVLPYAKGNAMQVNMASKFGDQSIYMLEIPKETFSIHLVLDNLKKAKLGENEYKSVWGYASYLRVKLIIPEYDEVLMEAKFRKIVKKTIIRSTPHTVKDWSIYKESIYVLVDSFTKNISEQDEDWLASVTATENITEQLEVFNEKIISCQ